MAAIVGVGTVGCGRFAERSPADLANQAVQAALTDGGLSRSQLDGLLVQIGSPRGVDYDVLARLLGLNVVFASQTWSHGRFMSTVIQHAALALAHDLAEYIVCIGAYKNSGFARHGMPGHPGFNESTREGDGPHSEVPSVGMAAPMAGAAMSVQRYIHKYSVDREKLGAVAVAQRKHGALKPGAILADQPLTQDDYERSPYVVEPLRRADCSVPVDVATAVIVARADRAHDLPSTPVYISGFQPLPAGVNEFIFGQPGLGVNQAEVFDFTSKGPDERVFRMAGLAPKDIGTLHVYDAFTSQVLWTLERFGYCGPGEAADWVQGGRIELGGDLPVNTSGGMLAEGHANGWGHIVEIVDQLRGSAGQRQIPDLHHAQWATALGDSVIYSDYEV